MRRRDNSNPISFDAGDALATRVIECVARSAGLSAELMRQNRNFEVNFDVDGDDGDELMMAYGKEFGVDLSNFTFSDYFGAEGVVDPISLVLALFERPNARSARRKLTIGNLVESARKGRWEETEAPK